MSYQTGTRDDYVRIIIAEGRRRGITPRGIVIGIATGLVESNLKIYASSRPELAESLRLPHDAVGSDHLSVGIFQQQVRQTNGVWWWGDIPTCMNPTTSAGLFFDRLAKLDYNSPAKTPGRWADAVQRSAYPDRYDERMNEAQALYDRLAASAPAPERKPAVEKVLDYDRTIVTQETGYWCGPASTQNVLNNRGVNRSEQDLAREMGTHTGGTDHIGLIAPVLNRYLPDAKYVVVQMPNDPPTAAQRDALWANVTRSINAGYGAVVNIVAPPSNYPRAVPPSTVSPAYSGGTVYHYIAIMGYRDDGNGTRAFWVADSGFRPFGYWCSLQQMATLIPPKGYTYATGGTPIAPADPDSDGGFLMAGTEYQSLYVDENGVRSTFKADLPTYVLLNDAKVERLVRDNAKMADQLAEQGRIIAALGKIAGVK